jgi:hypothetical protein
LKGAHAGTRRDLSGMSDVKTLNHRGFGNRRLMAPPKGAGMKLSSGQSRKPSEAIVPPSICKVVPVIDRERSSAIRKRRSSGDWKSGNMHRGSPLPAFRAMGSPKLPTVAQIAALRQAAEIPPPQTLRLDSARAVTIDLPPEGVALLESSS